jgi:hypothetical protein
VVLPLALLLTAACGDARHRPAPPVVELTLANGGVVPSPGVLRATLHVTDENGLDTLRVSIHSADERLIEDTLFFAFDAFDSTHNLEWMVPSGMSDGVGIQVVARARSYIGFSAADTVFGIVRRGGSAVR